MNAASRLAERLARGFNQLPLWRGECRFWGLRFSAATFERWLYLRMHWLGRMGRAERTTLGRLVRPGMTVLDVGGNIGVYTVLLSRLVGPAGRVISFEPDPDLCASLRENCARNGCTNVTVHGFALGRQADRLVLRRLILNSGDNTLGAGGSGLFRQEVAVEVVALDEFLPGLRPDFVKVDVQGWELPVLQGMAHTLAANPQAALCVEFWPAGLRRAGYAPGDLISFLHDRGYQLRRGDDDAVLDAAALETLTRETAGLKHVDLHATKAGAAVPKVER